MPQSKFCANCGQPVLEAPAIQETDYVDLRPQSAAQPVHQQQEYHKPEYQQPQPATKGQSHSHQRRAQQATHQPKRLRSVKHQHRNRLQCRFIWQIGRILASQQSYRSFGLGLVRFTTENWRKGLLSWWYTHSVSS